MAKLGEWIKEKHGSQAAFAELLGVTQSRVSKWLSGYEPIPDDFRKRIEAMKYKGPWPRQEGKEAPAQADTPLATAKDVAELRGALRAHIEQWERGQEKVLQRLEAVARKLGIPKEDAP